MYQFFSKLDGPRWKWVLEPVLAHLTFMAESKTMRFKPLLLSPGNVNLLNYCFCSVRCVSSCLRRNLKLGSLGCGASVHDARALLPISCCMNLNQFGPVRSGSATALAVGLGLSRSTADCILKSILLCEKQEQFIAWFQTAVAVAVAHSCSHCNCRHEKQEQFIAWFQIAVMVANAVVAGAMLIVAVAA
ncbi:hypothetical protein E2542_SST18700 [Spatholobus suberectus]|nr:hypothetical protein E2542_SST18700 [Spatholobus suberectus]